MKSRIILLFASLLLCGSSFAQSVTALHSGGNVTYYDGPSGLINAAAAASDGDTIYLPGGTVTGTAINNSVVLVGVSFFGDSTVATGSSIVSGGMSLTTDSIQLWGIEVTGGSVSVLNNSDYIELYRCRIGASFTANGSLADSCEFIKARQCVFESTIGLVKSKHANFANCIFEHRLIGGSTSTGSIEATTSFFSNNIFMYNSYTSGGYGTYSPIMGFDGILLQNNIFLGGSTKEFHVLTNGSILNNIFVSSNLYYYTNSNSGNWAGVSQSSIWVSQSGVSYNESHDYNLQSPGTYLGTDSTQVGIYGGGNAGADPWKDGVIPFNPHISSATIDPTTNSSGQLPVNIKVIAQDE